MAILPCDGNAVCGEQGSPPIDGLERILRILSVATMVMTVPQVYTIWVDGNATGVSLLSWITYLVSACVWFVYGIRKRDKTIYLACIGWIALDAAILAGIIVHR